MWPSQKPKSGIFDVLGSQKRPRLVNEKNNSVVDVQEKSDDYAILAGDKLCIQRRLASSSHDLAISRREAVAKISTLERVRTEGWKVERASSQNAVLENRKRKVEAKSHNA